MYEKLVIDQYSLRARLLPSLITSVPVLILAILFFDQELSILNSTVSVIVWAGIYYLLSQIGRDFGKKREGHLFSKWGGKPTTLLISYKYSSNRVRIDHIHKKIQQLLPDLKIPTELEEEMYPNESSDIYDSIVQLLRQRTRNKKEFPLIYEENCNYGFRRNLWGLKTVGIILNLVGLLFLAYKLYQTILLNIPVSSPIFISALILVALLIMWVFLINTEWVKISAFAYAERLVEVIS